MSGLRPVQTPTTVLAKHRFVSGDKNLITFNYSDEIEVTHESPNWLKGRSLVTRQPGFFPVNYVTRIGDAAGSMTAADACLSELNQTIHQWGVLLGHFIQTKSFGPFEDLKNRVAPLLEYRRLLLESADKMTEDELKVLISKSLDEIDKALRDLNLDIVVRLPNRRIATIINTGAFSLLNLHYEQAAPAPPKDEKDPRTRTSSVSPTVSKQVKVPKGSIKMRTANELAAITAGSGGASGSFTMKGKGPGGLYQLWVQLWMVLADVGSEFEVRVALYNRSNCQYITEEWVVVYDAETQPVDRPKEMGKIHAVFRDIESTEMSTGEVIVTTRIVRRGAFSQEEGKGKSKGKTERPLRRPFGAGFARLDTRHALEVEYETRVDLFSCPEGSFGILPEMLMAETRDPDIKPAQKTKGVILKTRLFSTDFEDLVGANPFLKEADVVDILKVPEVVMPGTVRNDVYLTLEEGEFSEKNVEVSVYVRRNNESAGQLGACMSAGVGEKQVDCFRGTTLSSSSPKWKETVRIRIDEAALLDAHVYFEFRHSGSGGSDASKSAKPFGFAFLRLSDSETVIKGDRQKIPVYRFQSKGGSSASSSASGGAGAGDTVTYLDDADKKEYGKSFLVVSARISSTLFSQNDHLIRLFKWRDNTSSIQDILRKLTFVNNEEIVRHIEQVFHALFDMLEAKEDNADVQQTIYEAILFTIGKLTESRTAFNFRPVLDCYFQTRYKSTGQHGPLLRCLVASLQHVDSAQQTQAINSSMKVLDYLWTIIIQSRINYITQNNLSTQKDDTFKKSLLRFLDTLRAVMARDSRTLIAAQNSGFKHFPAILRGLTRFFAPVEICDSVIEFLATSEQLSGLPKIVAAKLGLYATLATGDFLAAADTRLKLFPAMVGFLQRQLEHAVADLEARAARGGAETAAAILASPASPEAKQDELLVKVTEGARCVEIFGVLADILQVRATLAERERHLALLLPVLPVLIAFGAFAGKAGGASGPDERGTLRGQQQQRSQAAPEKLHAMLREEVSVLTVMLGMLRVMSPDDWESFINRGFADDGARIRFLGALCDYFASSLDRAPFPRTWGSMVGFEFGTMLKFAHTMEASPFFRKRAQAYNLAEVADRAETAMWASFFRLCLKFTSARALGLGQVSLVTLERYGDLRAPMSGIFRRMWRLFPKKIAAFPGMVIDLLNLMNLEQRTVKMNALESYFATIQSEFQETGKLETTKGYTVDAFDVGTFQKTFSEFFFSSLQSRFQQVPGLADLWEDFRSLQTYIDLICAYEATPEDPDNGDARISAIHDLLDYLRANNRRLPYIKYVHILCERHLHMQSFTEAGLSFLLHADLYRWDEEAQVPAMHAEQLFDFPAQPAWTLRETLLNMAISYLDQGTAWEHAIVLQDDIAAFNETRQYNYRAAAQALRNEARMYRKLVEQERLPTSYYRVGFFGKGFPPSMANKEFIYKGKPLEKLGDFTPRIEAQYPGAEMLKKTDYPGPEVTESRDMKILITAVDQSSELEMKGNSEASPSAVAAPRVDSPKALVPAVGVFCYGKAFRKAERSKEENEFLGLWLSRLYMVAKQAFPSTRTRSEVAVRQENTYTPLEHAIKQMREKSAGLLVLIEKYETGSKDMSTQPLVMALNGVICAPVNGGVMMFRDSFLTVKYLAANPRDGELLARLRSEISRQIEILGRGMAVFDSRCTQDMRSLFELLHEKLESTRADWDASSTDPVSPSTSPALSPQTNPVGTNSPAGTPRTTYTSPVPNSGSSAIGSARQVSMTHLPVGSSSPRPQ